MWRKGFPFSALRCRCQDPSALSESIRLNSCGSSDAEQKAAYYAFILFSNRQCFLKCRVCVGIVLYCSSSLERGEPQIWEPHLAVLWDHSWQCSRDHIMCASRVRTKVGCTQASAVIYLRLHWGRFDNFSILETRTFIPSFLPLLAHFRLPECFQIIFQDKVSWCTAIPNKPKGESHLLSKQPKLCWMLTWFFYFLIVLHVVEPWIICTSMRSGIFFPLCSIDQIFTATFPWLTSREPKKGGSNHYSAADSLMHIPRAEF